MSVSEIKTPKQVSGTDEPEHGYACLSGSGLWKWVSSVHASRHEKFRLDECRLRCCSPLNYCCRRLDVGEAGQKRSWLLFRLWHRCRSAVPPPSKSLSGFGFWWSVNVHWLLVAVKQLCGGYHPYQSAVTAPSRNHRHHLYLKGCSPGIPSVTLPSD